MKKRIAYLSEFESRHGGENSLLAILPRLRENGVIPMVIAPPQGDFAEAVRRLDVELVAFQRTDEHGDTMPLAKAREVLTGLLRNIRPDILHANSLAMGRFSGPVTAELRIPGFSHLRDIVRLNRQAVDDLNRHRCLLAVSHVTRQYHVGQGIRAEKCHVLYNGIDSACFRFRPPNGFLHRELRFPENAVLIGNIGQIGLRKGHDTLLDVMSLLLGNETGRHVNLHLLVIGKRWSSKAESIEYERRLHQRASEPPLAGHVHFLGRRQDVPEILNELTLLVHTARQEPLGRVLLEAAASQVPVVAAEVGGTREIFTPLPQEQTVCRPAAMLVPCDNTVAFASAVSVLLSDEKLRKELAGSARHIVATRFSIEQSVTQLLSHYETILREHVA
ncbi:MAG: glycosyltransferase family 4 protein [Planctomycetaceae bacterium]|nr:glycosyltransferase family 4 protein [Planctomycetaceae bacterium]